MATLGSGVMNHARVDSGIQGAKDAWPGSPLPLDFIDHFAKPDGVSTDVRASVPINRIGGLAAMVAILIVFPL